MPQLFNLDAQQSLSFVQNQANVVNSQVYETRYPDYDFSRYIFVDRSSPEWAGGITTYISDASGAANWQSGYAKDVPLADVNLSETQQVFHMAAIGYQWNVEEVGKAMFMNVPLQARRAQAARKAYEQFMYSLTFGGPKAVEKNIPGLLNAPGVTAGTFPADGTGGSTFWSTKTPAQIVRDINSLLTGIFTGTYETELADTLILPTEDFLYIAQTPFSENTMETILSFVQKTNVYTIQTGRPLNIVASRAAANAGAGGLGRVAAYKNDQTVAKLHLPMDFRFLPVYQDGPLNFVIPGIFRTGGVEILQPLAFRYGDGSSA